jgi:hypothetical protein
MIKVKWLKPHSSFGYFAGDLGYVTADWAAKLVATGYVMLLPEDGLVIPAVPSSPPVVPLIGGQISGSKDDNPLPEDLPGREKLFEAGYRELEKIKEAGDLLMDAGISKSMCKSIAKYLKAK